MTQHRAAALQGSPKGFHFDMPLGTLRFLLASLVALNHLWLPTANQVGAHAVTAFYMISGFLMTKVIQERYGLSAGGVSRFLINRWFRIFPTYLTFVALTALMIALFPNFAAYSTMVLPTDLSGWTSNLTLWNLPYTNVNLIPPAWSLTIEFFFYIAMPLLLVRTRALAFVWFGISLAIAIYLLAIGATFAQRYTPTYSASLYFSIGAIIYFTGAQMLFRVSPRTALILVVLFCPLPLLSNWLGFPLGTVGYYGASLLFVPVFLAALRIRGDTIDRWLGDLAYPLFLTHFFAAGIVKLMMPHVPPLSLRYFAASFVICILISIASVLCIDRTVERIRTTIRGSQSLTGSLPRFEIGEAGPAGR